MSAPLTTRGLCRSTEMFPNSFEASYPKGSATEVFSHWQIRICFLTSPQLMEMPSFALSPVAPVLFSLSEPARSTKWNLAVRVSNSSISESLASRLSVTLSWMKRSNMCNTRTLNLSVMTSRDSFQLFSLVRFLHCYPESRLGLGRGGWWRWHGSANSGRSSGCWRWCETGRPASDIASSVTGRSDNNVRAYTLWEKIGITQEKQGGCHRRKRRFRNVQSLK